MPLPPRDPYRSSWSLAHFDSARQMTLRGYRGAPNFARVDGAEFHIRTEYVPFLHGLMRSDALESHADANVIVVPRAVPGLRMLSTWVPWFAFAETLNSPQQCADTALLICELGSLTRNWPSFGVSAVFFDGFIKPNAHKEHVQ